jgi:hypothetical protein
VLAVGRYPRRVFTFMEGVGRFFLSVLAFAALLTDAYPPMALHEILGYPVRFELDYPVGGRVSRWRPLVAWIAVLPQYVMLAFVYVGVAFLVFVAMISILLTRTYPYAPFVAVVRVLRFHAALNAYACFMIDRYPGFRF